MRSPRASDDDYGPSRYDVTVHSGDRRPVLYDAHGTALVRTIGYGHAAKRPDARDAGTAGVSGVAGWRNDAAAPR